MEQLTTNKFESDLKRAFKLKRKIDMSLVDSIEYLIEITDENGLLSDKHSMKYINQIIQNKLLFRGYPFILHKKLIDDLNNDCFESTEILITELTQPYIYLASDLVLTLNNECLGKNIQERYAQILQNDDTFTLAVSGIDSATYENAKHKINESLKFLKTSNLELYGEIRTYIQEIILTKCLTPNVMYDSGSDFNCYSTIFINGENTEKPWMYYLEGIVHEAAHMHLFAINSEDDLILNRVTERFDAPLRKDKRSMSGVYHATFVLARILYAFSGIREACSLNSDEQHYIEKLMRDYQKRFFLSMDLINNSAKMTKLAEELIDNTNEYVRRVTVC